MIAEVTEDSEMSVNLTEISEQRAKIEQEQEKVVSRNTQFGPK